MFDCRQIDIDIIIIEEIFSTHEPTFLNSGQNFASAHFKFVGRLFTDHVSDECSNKLAEIHFHTSTRVYLFSQNFHRDAHTLKVD